jgi:osmotically-inducible protein OsmY
MPVPNHKKRIIMLSTHRVTPRLLLSLIFLSLASCSVFQGQETAGQYTDDASITAKVKDAFVADAQVKAAEISVQTMQGVVQLSGFVDSAAMEKRAVELAQQITGVKYVRDNIIVRSSGGGGGH